MIFSLVVGVEHFARTARAPEPYETLSAGLVYGFACGLVMGILAICTTFMNDADAGISAAPDPIGLLCGDRSRTLARSITIGGITGVAAAVGATVAARRTYGTTGGTTVG
ncbi:hypothetical protein Val02_91520 [Virgisporangium aliadipatigenens]|uniref:Uncharacterized protein n=1 Tax=Virgisporangium aliadipatigenens TaxID=741659 RepID=A0A8J3YYX2_9ACTN|nr:hypothetical protein Val02_91520 [Virgisporangium aliadipatigenens]